MGDKFFKPPKVRTLYPDRKTPGDGGGSSRRLSAQNLSRCSTREARSLIEFPVAEKLNVLPLGIINLREGRVLTAAAANTDDPELLTAAKFAAGMQVKLIGVEANTLSDARFIAYHGDERRLERRLKDLRILDSRMTAGTANTELKIDLRQEGGEAATFLTALLDYGISHGASDIHIVPTITGSWVKLRVNGELLEHEGAVCSLTLHRQIMNRIKVLAGLDTTKQATPQDGSFTIPVNDNSVHARVSLMPTLHGEKAVIRLLGCQGMLTLDSLGFDDQTRVFVDQFLGQDEGMCLLAGATGSGKTTSLYAILDALRTTPVSISTLEDPVELRIDGISQTSINPGIGLDYPACLRAVLRQDPDVLMVGEIRDTQSAQIAAQAALTGHRLFSTVHARNVGEVFLRLKNLELDTVTIAQSLRLIVCQQLLPRLCPHCKVADLQASQMLAFETFKPVGCHRCDYSGFDGRVLAAESLWIETGLRRALADGSLSLSELPHRLGEYTHTPMRRALENLLKVGSISMNQYMTSVADHE